MRVLKDFQVSVREESRGSCCSFLGVMWDLGTHTASFIDHWRAKARALVADVGDRPLAPKVLQRVVGMCVWAHTLKGEPLVFLSHLLAHLAHVSRSQDSTGPVLPLPSNALADVQATMDGLDDAFALAAPCRPRHPLDLWTDSSSVGAAFVWASPDLVLDVQVGRHWRWDVDTTHINLKELSSLYVALLAQPSLQDTQIRWACDNLSCVNIVKKLHSRSPPMNLILRKIVLLCRSRRLDILPVWVPTQFQLADGPSRSTAGSECLRVFP